MKPQKQVMMPLFRYALIAAGSSLVTRGYLSTEDLNTIVGSLLTLGTSLWLIYIKTTKR